MKFGVEYFCFLLFTLLLSTSSFAQIDVQANSSVGANILAGKTYQYYLGGCFREPNSKAVPNINLKLYLSKDNSSVIDASDVLLSTWTTNLDLNTIAQCSYAPSVTIPANIAWANQSDVYFIFIVDYTKTITETDENNNIIVSQSYKLTSSVAAPSSPTSVFAVAGSLKADVSFAVPSDNGGSAITSYTVTSNPGNITAKGTSSPITVTGLIANQAYTFTVTATNSAGTSLPSTASNSIIVQDVSVPSEPTAVTVTGSYESANVTFEAPSNNGGSAITQYTVTSNPEGITVSGSSSPISVKGLTGGTTYSFTVVATNSIGNSNPSVSSNAVTPLAITVPSVPTSVTGTSDFKSAKIYFTPPSNNGGLSITSYTVTSTPEGIKTTGTSSPIIVSGLTNGTSYTFTVSATNSKGASAESLPTAPIIPIAVTNDSLLAHYTFDGNANDVSGNGNHGVISGGLTFANDELGNSNAAALFNGTDSYITIPKPNKLNFAAGASFTITAKVKATSNTGASGSYTWVNNQIFAKYAGATGQGNELVQLYYNITGGTALASIRNASVSLLTVSGTANNFGAYHNVAVVKDAKASTLNLYIDGILISSKALVASFSTTTALDCWIGKQNLSGGASANLFKGTMDDLKIYTRALSLGEIKDQITSVDNNEILSGVFIGSNPTSTEFDLYTSTPLNISVSSVDGIEIDKFSTNQNLKFGASYSSGVYLVNINNGNTVKVIKVVKQ